MRYERPMVVYTHEVADSPELIQWLQLVASESKRFRDLLETLLHCGYTDRELSSRLS